jgi:hypothetical protein
VSIEEKNDDYIISLKSEGIKSEGILVQSQDTVFDPTIKAFS